MFYTNFIEVDNSPSLLETPITARNRIKFIAVIAGAIGMIGAALIFSGNSLSSMETSARIYEQTPSFMIYSESERYNMTKGETIIIPLMIDVDQKGKEVRAQITVVDSRIFEENTFVEVSDMTLPEGLSGSLDRTSIYLPSSSQDEIITETLYLTLTSREDLTAGDYVLSPTVLGKDIVGTPIRVSSSFMVHIE